MPRYFKSMYVYIARCNDFNYRPCFYPDATSAQALRAEVLSLNGLTENSSKAEREAAFVKFASFYARVRHGANGIHHLYGIHLRNATKFLPEILHEIGILQAWNPTSSDIENLNMLRVKVAQRGSPVIRAEPFTFLAVNATTNTTESVTGVLPFINVKICPSFHIPFAHML